jgi:hypothetical protein
VFGQAPIPTGHRAGVRLRTDRETRDELTLAADHFRIALDSTDTADCSTGQEGCRRLLRFSPNASPRSVVQRNGLVEGAEVTARTDAKWRSRYFHLMMPRERKITKVATARTLAVQHYRPVGPVRPANPNENCLEPRTKPHSFELQKSYDAEVIRQSLRFRGIRPMLAKRNTEHGSGLGRWRWVVERTFAWLSQFVCYRKGASFVAAR